MNYTVWDVVVPQGLAFSYIFAGVIVGQYFFERTELLTKSLPATRRRAAASRQSLLGHRAPSSGPLPLTPKGGHCSRRSQGSPPPSPTKRDELHQRSDFDRPFHRNGGSSDPVPIPKAARDQPPESAGTFSMDSFPKRADGLQVGTSQRTVSSLAAESEDENATSLIGGVGMPIRNNSPSRTQRPPSPRGKSYGGTNESFPRSPTRNSSPRRLSGANNSFSRGSDALGDEYGVRVTTFSDWLHFLSDSIFLYYCVLLMYCCANSILLMEMVLNPFRCSLDDTLMQRGFMARGSLGIMLLVLYTNVFIIIYTFLRMTDTFFQRSTNFIWWRRYIFLTIVLAPFVGMFIMFFAVGKLAAIEMDCCLSLAIAVTSFFFSWYIPSHSDDVVYSDPIKRKVTMTCVYIGVTMGFRGIFFWPGVQKFTYESTVLMDLSWTSLLNFTIAFGAVIVLRTLRQSG